jgi:hypothetical protein
MPTRKRAAASGTKSTKIAVETVNVPGYTHLVDATLYAAMRKALLRALPSHAPGLTQTEMRRAVLPYLSQDLFPKGAKVDWWAKSVQLDLEAKGVVRREDSKPLRWHRVK